MTKKVQEHYNTKVSGAGYLSKPTNKVRITAHPVTKATETLNKFK